MQDWRDRIEINPAILVGKPVIKGTRLGVEFILDLVAGGLLDTLDGCATDTSNFNRELRHGEQRIKKHSPWQGPV